MKKFKQLSGKEVVKIFEMHGFEVKRKVGSHVRLTLVQKDSSYHVTIPLHDLLKTGTLHSIVKDFEICFGKEEAEKYFLNL
jgi:predicted RNA binding protein YcfA (HicA-like mRNA interferase family)